MKIVNGKNMGLNPASVNLDTGVIEINARLFSKYDKITKQAIIAHEIGHYVEQNESNEELADKFALNFLAGKSERSLRRTVAALLAALKPCNIPESRKMQIIISALEIDRDKFGNKNAAQILNEIYARKSNATGSGAGSAAGGGLALASSIIAAAVQQIDIIMRFFASPKALWYAEGSDNNFGAKNPTRIELVRKA
ncbi:MAG: hypothetical protein LBF01_00710, partial [Bacteroidales bacterium]|nr:hypothetical protein [Bacteroidales bacterium]